MMWRKRRDRVKFNLLDDPLAERIRLRTEAEHREEERRGWLWDEVVLTRIYLACMGLSFAGAYIIVSTLFDRTGPFVLELIDDFLLGM